MQDVGRTSYLVNAVKIHEAVLISSWGVLFRHCLCRHFVRSQVHLDNTDQQCLLQQQIIISGSSREVLRTIDCFLQASYIFVITDRVTYGENVLLGTCTQFAKYWY